MPQAFYNKEAGTKALTTETGAGQWGSALAMACNFFDMDLEVYMVKVSYYQKPYRRMLIEAYGAEVYASPTDRTNYGRSVLAEDPDSPGSLGIAISEAVEVAATSGGAKKYSLGSVLNHVLLHQTVIGEEALLQMEMAGEYPDMVIGLHRRRLQLRRLRLPVPARESDATGKTDEGHCRRTGRLAQPDTRQIHLRLRRHGEDGAGGQDAHAGPHASSRRRFTPAVCATTACRRRSARWWTVATSKRGPCSSWRPLRRP